MTIIERASLPRSETLREHENILEHLRKLKFIGIFPRGIEVLLVPIDTATLESKILDKELTSGKLKTILLTNNIYIFSSVEDWDKFNNPDKATRKKR